MSTYRKYVVKIPAVKSAAVMIFYKTLLLMNNDNVKTTSFERKMKFSCLGYMVSQKWHFLEGITHVISC